MLEDGHTNHAQSFQSHLTDAGCLKNWQSCMHSGKYVWAQAPYFETEYSHDAHTHTEATFFPDKKCSKNFFFLYSYHKFAQFHNSLMSNIQISTLLVKDLLLSTISTKIETSAESLLNSKF